MPIVQYPEDRLPLAAFGTVNYKPAPEEKELSPDTATLLGAAFRQSNTIGSMSANKLAGVDLATREDGFTGDAMWNELKGTPYEQHWDRFANVFNRTAFNAMKAQIDMETEDRRTVDSAGWWGTGASLLAGVVDLPSLIPGGELAAGVSAGRAALTTGLRTAAAGALGASASELALQATQQTRPLSESAMAIGSGAVLGGFLGAGAGALLSHAERAAALRAVEGALSAKVPTPDEFARAHAESVGAAAVDRPELSDFDIAPGAKTVGAALGSIAPVLRTAQSPSAVYRSVMANVHETGFYLEKNVRGEGDIAAESAIKYWDRGALSKGLTDMRETYLKARSDGLDMTAEEFRTAVSKAMRRGDVGEHDAVSKAAQSWRSTLFDPLKNEAIEAGLLPPDVSVKTATSYLTRLWNPKALNADEERFKQIVRPWIDDQLAQLEFKSNEIRIGNQIVDADKKRETFGKVSDRLDSIESRLSDRQGIRQRKVSALQQLQQTRQDVLKERAPADLVKMLSGADENAAMVDTVREARAAARSAARKQSYAERFPVLSVVKRKGGVRVGSKLDYELRAMDVTPKTHPGLFVKNGGIGDVDNFVQSEDAIFARLADDGAGYVDPRAVMESIRSELGGTPLRTAEEEVTAAALDNLDKVAGEWLERIGLAPNATVKAVRDFIDRVRSAEKNTAGLDSRVSRFEQEIEEFDRATDAILNESKITAAEAKTVGEELAKLEAELDAVKDLAEASPRVALVADYGSTRRDIFKAKLSERSLSKRVDALKRLEAEGEANADILAELAAKSIELDRLRANIDGLRVKADKLEPMMPKVKQEIPDFVSPDDRADYVKGIVDDIFDQLTGRAKQGMPSYDMVMAARGPLKERTFNIPDELIEEFLEHDIELIARRYARVMSADVELAKLDSRLGGTGKPTLLSQLDRVKDDYRALREAAAASIADPKQLQRTKDALDKAEKRDAQDLAAVRDLLRGQYEVGSQQTNYARTLRVAGQFNYMRQLGGVTVSSLSDAARPPMVHGLMRYMGQGVLPLITNLKAVKMSIADAKLLGAVTERTLQSRLATMSELTDPYARQSPFERFMDNAANIFSRMTLLPFWNDFHKSVASVLTQNRVLKNALSVDEGLARAPTPAEPVRADVEPDAFYHQPTASLDDLYRSGAVMQDDLDALGNSLADELGVEYRTKGLKDRGEAEKKIPRKGYEDASQLTDIVRGGFLVDTPAKADEIISRLAERFDVLDEGWGFSPTGYFDRKALVRAEDGTVGEVQFWEPTVLAAKKEGGAHKLYKQARELPPGSPERERLDAEQREIYSAAMREAGDDWANLGSSSEPKLLKRARQASSDMMRPDSDTSLKSTVDQSAPGFNTALASDLPSTAGRPSQFRNSMGNSFGDIIPQSDQIAYAALDDAERKYMGYVGIDEDMAKRIARQFREHGQIDGNVHIPGLADWTDEGARRAFAAAVNKDVDSTIVTKSVADVPLFAHTPTGRALFQFKTFAMASNQRVLMRGLQEGPGSFITGMVGMSALGMLTYYLKQVEANRDLSDNPGRWVAEGVDRSGIFQLAFEVNNTWEKLGGPGVYFLASRAFPGRSQQAPASRYATRDAFGAFLGPTFQLGTDAAQLLGIPLTAASTLSDADPNTNPDLHAADVNRSMQMIPFLTLPYWRWIFEGGFGLGDAGIKPQLREAVGP